MADLKVATLHPVLTDLAQQVGGEHVEVIGLLKPGGDPHDFSPSSGDIRKMSASKLILASGKGIEPYLAKLPDSLSANQQIIDVGAKIPSLVISEDNGLFVCCPHHSEGSLDPHWWHSVKNMDRATKIVASAFAKADPVNKAAYASRAKAYRTRLAALGKWARKEVARIPRSKRKLATAHAAFTYFCEEFGFKSMPVQGLAREREASSQYMADVIVDLKTYKVKAVFPEAQANPKVLQEMVRETGARVGGILFADFTGNAKTTTYEAMFAHNVKTILAGLAPQ
ncbi:MAG: zinc/manganese transport system substrate-binding protein [Verrucomicrobiales bacterium]|jgi:zinc/manganese transport system substrate-binding protein